MNIKRIKAILFGKITHIKYGDRVDKLDSNGDFDIDIRNLSTGRARLEKGKIVPRNVWSSEVEACIEEVRDFYGVIKGDIDIHIPLIIDAKRVRFPRQTFLFSSKTPSLKASTTILHMKSIQQRNADLMKEVKNEIKSLNADMPRYIEAGLEDQYKTTHDILLVNKAMLEQQGAAIEMAIMKAEVTHREIDAQTRFLDSLKGRETRIRKLAHASLMLHSETATAMQLIENKVGDINALQRLCSGVLSLSDPTKIEIIQDTLKQTESDFHTVFSEQRIAQMVS